MKLELRYNNQDPSYHGDEGDEDMHIKEMTYE